MNLIRRHVEAEIATPVGITGEFRLVVSRPDGSIVREMEFPNLLLNAGLNRLGTDNGIGFCTIGAGTSTPTATETTLQSRSQSTNTTLAGSATTSGGASPYWTGYTFGFRFPIGSLNGNYTEVGVGWTSTLMASRALILDIGGAPTTITVGSGEQLDVFYTRKLYPPLTDVVTTPSIGGVSTTVTTRAHVAGSINNTESAWNASEWPRTSRTDGEYCYAYSGAIGVLTGSPSGTQSTPDSCSNSAYSNNSYTRAINVSFGLARGNVGGGIAAAICGWRMCSFQYGFSPAIAKTSAQTLALVYSTTWARRP